MRVLAAFGLGIIVACGPSPAADPEPVATLVIPPLDASAAPIATAPPTAAPDPVAPPDPHVRDDVDAARDPLGQRVPRKPALVATEINGLDSLFATTTPTSPDRAALEKRCADDRFELARLKDGTAATKLRTDAIARYDDIVTTAPKFNKLDEVLYYEGLAAELNGDLRKARQTYYDLIKRFPQSKYIPYAYLAFGEMFYAESKQDASKADLARQAYHEVIKYPPPLNGVYFAAKKRLGALGPP